MKDLTVLITAAGNVFMPGTIACLKNNGERSIRVIGADMSDDSTILQMCDTAYQVPRGSDPAYVDVLLEICRRERVDLLLPIMSVELEALAENKERFEQIGTRVSVSDPRPLSVANNKRMLLEFLRESGLPCAEFAAVKSLEELRTAAAALGYPKNRVCVKAVNGSGSRGFRILDGNLRRYDMFINSKPTSGLQRLEELADTLAEAESFPDLIVMEYLPGTEYSVDLRMENSIMLEAEIVDHPAAQELCALVTEKLGLDGNIGFDIRERDDGSPMIMECNPRITAGIPYFQLAGVNLPYLCVKKLLGESLPPAEPEYGKIIRRRWMEMAT